MNEFQRLSVNINDASAETLRAAMSDRGVSATEVTRRAIAYLGLMEDLRHRGATLVVVEQIEP
jgi:hypothetical protein